MSKRKFSNAKATKWSKEKAIWEKHNMPGEENVQGKLKKWQQRNILILLKG